MRMLGIFAWLGAAGLGHAEQISHSTFEKVDQWFIREPDVDRESKVYHQIVIRPGDTVLVAAGGCAQTGGSGKTWKKYVDPQGPNSDRFYHGLIGGLPGFGTVTIRIQDFLHSYGGYYVAPWSYPAAEFVLGYEDEKYGDNGYYAHDDGTGGQCSNVENAWVNVTVIHP